jgi:hypothetical protein
MTIPSPPFALCSLPCEPHKRAERQLFGIVVLKVELAGLMVFQVTEIGLDEVVGNEWRRNRWNTY